MKHMTKAELMKEIERLELRIAELEAAGHSLDEGEPALSEERYRAFVQTSLDGFWINNMEGRFLDVNEAYCRIIGYSREELLRMRIPDVEAAEEPEKTARHIRKILKEGYDRFETRHRRKDGAIVDIEVSATYSGVGGGQLVVFLRNITDRMRAEEELVKYRQHLEELVKERTAQVEAANQQLRAANQQLRATEQQLRAANQQLRATEQQLRASNLQLKGGMERLRESESKFKRLYDSNIIGVIFWDTAGNIVQANNEFLRIVGYTEEDILSGKARWKDMTPPEYAYLDEKVIKEMTETGISAPFEKEYIRKDGSRVPIRLNAALLKGEKDIGICFIQDITERKRAEEALRAASVYARSLIEACLDPLVTISTGGKITDVNAASVEATGVPRERLIGTDFSDYFTEPQRAREGYQRVFSEGCVRDYPLAIRHVSGRIINVLYNASLYRDENGQVLGVFAAARDITARKQAEEALALQVRIAAVFLTVPDDEMFNEVLKVILEVMHSPFGVFGFIDEAGALVVPTMTRQIWDKCQVPDKTIVFPRATWGDSSWPRAIREKKPNYSNEVSTKTPTGHVTVTRHISVPILFQGELIGIFQVANRETDYTEADVRSLEAVAGQVAPLLSARLRRERAQAALRKLNAELEQRVQERTAALEAANKELEAFSYSVSHDLRAPLRAIDGFSRILLDEHAAQLPAEVQRYLGLVRSNTAQMGHLVDDLLTFSRLSRQAIRKDQIKPAALVREALDLLRSEQEGRNVEITAGEMPDCHGDRALLKQVFFNLLSNALKFTRKRDPAAIEVGYSRKDDESVYFVRDNGVGFDNRYVGKLFGVFQRLHRAEEFEGTGVGLAIVQRIVCRHGGRVWAEAELNKGATFYFTLGTKGLQPEQPERNQP